MTLASGSGSGFSPPSSPIAKFPPESPPSPVTRFPPEDSDADTPGISYPSYSKSTSSKSYPKPQSKPKDEDEIIDIFDSDEEGWQDMPIVREDELRGGLDEEDQRRYHYRPNGNTSGASGAIRGNATGTTLDTDEAGFRWRSNPTMAASNSSTQPSSSKGKVVSGTSGKGSSGKTGAGGGTALEQVTSPDGSIHSFATESNYTRLRHVEEDWEESDELRRSTAVLFGEDDFDVDYNPDYGYGDIDDRKALTPLSQMQQTKGLLSESQKIAYVGLCALVVKRMVGDISVPEPIKPSKAKVKNPPKPKIRKEFTPAVKSMSLWALKIMGRLYYHIELATEEQKMIESLADHGVEPSDLVPSLCEMKKMPRGGASAKSMGMGPPPAYPGTAPPAYSGSGITEKDENEDEEEDDNTVDHVEDSSSASKLNKDKDKNAENDKDKDVILLDMRYTLLCDLFLLLIADSVYDSRSRHLLFQVARCLGLSTLDTVSFESRVTEAVGISEDTEGEGGLQTNDEAVQAQITRTRRKRIALLGLATLGGGLVIGLSAGLLAPVIGVGLGSVFGTIGISGATTFLAGSAGAAVITTGGVLTGASIAGRGMSRRTRVVRTFDVLPLHKNGRVGCILSVPGFLNGPLDDPRLPFSVLDPIVGDVFSVLWEPEMIRETGSALKILTGEVLSTIGQTVLQATVMATLMTALQWPIILTKLGYLIDNPWSNALDRARAAGLVLASVLRDRQLGVRPITLVGFSLGARVIFYALLDLFRTSSFGIVQDVYLMGATLSVGVGQWYKARSVVGGRFVNVYARNDWVLNYLFRASSAATGTVAGLRPILNVPGLENVDVTDKIAGHMSYRVYMPVILEELGFRVTERWFDEVEEVDFEGDRVVISPEEEEAENAKRSWFGLGRRKSSSSFKNTNTNMSSKHKSNVQRPPSWASWADKDKHGHKKSDSKENVKAGSKGTSTGETCDDDDDDLPPRESTPVPPILSRSTPTGSNNPSRSSTPTPSSLAGGSNITAGNATDSSTSVGTPSDGGTGGANLPPPTAGFDFAAIKAELAELEKEKAKSQSIKSINSKTGTSSRANDLKSKAGAGVPIGLGLDALSEVEVPRIGIGAGLGTNGLGNDLGRGLGGVLGNGFGTVQEQDEEDDDLEEAYTNNPFASGSEFSAFGGGRGSTFEGGFVSGSGSGLTSKLGQGEGGGSSVSGSTPTYSFNAFGGVGGVGGSGLSFGDADGSITTHGLAETDDEIPDPWRMSFGNDDATKRDKALPVNPWG